MKGNSKTAPCPTIGSASDFLPERISLPQLRKTVQTCRGCDLYCHATQAVFGEGSRKARVMLVGEQPGDQEDLAGKPFVGPSGRLLDDVLDEVGIDRKHDVYVTNAIKHFKFEQRRKKRIHSKPSSRQINACKPWLEAEIQVVRPSIIVCLGRIGGAVAAGIELRSDEASRPDHQRSAMGAVDDGDVSPLGVAAHARSAGPSCGAGQFCQRPATRGEADQEN